MTNQKISCIILSGWRSVLDRPRAKQSPPTSFRESHSFIIRKMRNPNSSSTGLFFSFLVIAALNVSTFAQTAKAVDGKSDETGFGVTTLLIVMLCVSAAVAFLFWRKSKRASEQSQYNYTNRVKDYSAGGNYDEGVDAEMELAWLKSASKSNSKPAQRVPKKKSPTTDSYVAAQNRVTAERHANGDDLQRDARAFQERMKKIQFGQLPVNSFLQLTEPREIEPLPISDDPSLLNAIEQANEVYEDDDMVRELALRILARFKTQNSVEALSQIALYDISPNLRSKAVTTLTDFDHESVFETILLASADPTREVRAAAARGLFRLSFDRADAWKRIISTKDEFRMSHAARAATESGFVEKSFDRLLHDEMKIAYEAFALVGLLIMAGETDQIFAAIRENKDERIKLALLHVLSVVKDERVLAQLNELRTDPGIPTNVAEKIKETVESYEAIMA